MKRANNPNRPISLFSVLRHAMRHNSLCIVAPYYTEEKMNDGYLRRVCFSDTLLEPLPRIFLDFENPSKKTKFTRVTDNKIVVNFSPNKLFRRIIPFIIFLFCHRAYYESVWQVRKSLLKFPFLKNYVDVHGSVPEEEFLGERYVAAQAYGEVEEATIKHADYLFCVSNAMVEHFHKKYGNALKAKTVVLPIMDEKTFETNNFPKKKWAKKPLIVYAGGIFEWQNISLMQDVIDQRIDDATYRIYTPTPDLFWKTWPSENKPKNLPVKTATPNFLFTKAYPKANYGFALRDDIVVNNVACPTKITEYLRFGIIPIMKTENVGDFVNLGMKYLSLKDAYTGKYYSEKEYYEVVNNNYEVLKKYADLCKKGVKEFNNIMKGAEND